MAPLTTLQLEALKHTLDKQRGKRLRAAHETLQRVRQGHYAVLAGEGPDVVDVANAEELAGMENTLAQRDAEAVRDIDAALARIEEHRFGYCLDCGEDIGFRRLSAQPTATRCVRCQEQHDRLYRRTALPTL